MKSVSILSLAMAVQFSQRKYFKWLKLKKKICYQTKLISVLSELNNIQN